MVQEILLGADNNLNVDANTLQNVEIYVGDDPVYSNNQKCEGGPFLNIDASNQTTFVVSDASNDTLTGPWATTGSITWHNYGKEVWCNLKGRYTSIVADLKHMASQSTLDMSLCNVGIMGTKYTRSVEPASTITITKGQAVTIVVEDVAVDANALLQIGNTIDIELRQKVGNQLSWATVTQHGTEAQVLLDTSSVSAADYNLILESFDKNSSL